MLAVYHKPNFGKLSHAGHIISLTGDSSTMSL